MDVGEPIREIEVVPKHIPVPSRDGEKEPNRDTESPTPKEKEPVKHGIDASS